MTVKRTTQVAVEVLSATDPKARVSQVAVEVLSTTNPTARISQLAVEVLSSNDNVGAQPVLFILIT